ncbi:MAG: PHP domain-containing protein [Aquiluna sp.]|nr:PHP domain-containing protein [Aquiluna sp.]
MIDLHAHSNNSDGKDSPTELVENAAKANVSVLAITDHDTTAGWEEAITAGSRFGVRIIPGIEVSTRQFVGNHRSISVHILAYLPDPANSALVAELEKTRNSRINRAKKMAELLAVDYPITWELVLAELPEGSTIGRPAIADALVTAGIVPNRSDAFTSILHSQSKYYVSDHSVSTVEAIGLVRSAGGVSVIAHPLIDFPPGQALQDLPAEFFSELISAGLNGIEIDHRAVPARAKPWLRQLALKHDLVITGSSDYHGVDGKENRLGENSTSEQMLQRILDQATGFEPPL